MVTCSLSLLTGYRCGHSGVGAWDDHSHEPHYPRPEASLLQLLGVSVWRDGAGGSRRKVPSAHRLWSLQDQELGEHHPQPMHLRRQAVDQVAGRCTSRDSQQQETPDAIPEGETPHTVTLYAYEDLVDVAKPGDRVEITGVFRAQPMRNNPRMRAVKSVYKTYIDCLHIKKTEKDRLGSGTGVTLSHPLEDTRVSQESEFYSTYHETDENPQVLEERDEKLRQLSKLPDIYEQLTRSLAPSIWELDDVKKGVLCQLFGGTHKVGPDASHCQEFKETGIGRFRGEINVLLCGDPGKPRQISHPQEPANPSC